MPDLHCPECGKERFERIAYYESEKTGETYYVEGQCECGELRWSSPILKTGVANLGFGKMGRPPREELLMSTI